MSTWMDCFVGSEEDEGWKERTRSMKLVLDLYPATAVVLYMLSFGIGVGTVPWLLLGELCPSKVPPGSVGSPPRSENVILILQYILLLDLIDSRDLRRP
jgi:hypothetical protein